MSMAIKVLDALRLQPSALPAFVTIDHKNKRVEIMVSADLLYACKNAVNSVTEDYPVEVKQW